MLKIEKFDNIVVSTKMCFSTPNDTRFQLERKGFDKNGNPRYILSMSVENMLKIKENKKNKCYKNVIIFKKGVAICKQVCYNTVTYIRNKRSKKL